jgi:hypothetical protein
MRRLSETVAQLEARRAQLERELAGVDARLQAISQALEVQAGGARAAANGAAHAAPRGNGARAGKAPATKRVWFEKNEVATLLRKAARTPTPVADVVRELARLKGYAGKLSGEDLKRFQGAAFMAVAQAVKTRVLKRRPNGSVVVV